MPKECSNDENALLFRHWCLVIDSSFDIRISSFARTLAIAATVDQHAPADGCETEQCECARLRHNIDHQRSWWINVIIIKVSIRDFRDPRALADGAQSE